MWTVKYTSKLRVKVAQDKNGKPKPKLYKASLWDGWNCQGTWNMLQN